MTRNFSRKGKSYLYGNKHLEQKFILSLRNFFRIPFESKTPTHLLKWGAEQRFADQMDRDYELWEANAHPFQIAFYNFYNTLRQEQIENQELRNQGVEPMEDQILRISNERIEQEAAATGKEVDRMRQADIFMESIRQANSTMYNEGREVEGSFNDFLDVRRPSIQPTQSFTH